MYHTQCHHTYHNQHVNWNREQNGESRATIQRIYSPIFWDIFASNSGKNLSQEWLNAFSGLTFSGWYVALQRALEGIWPKSHCCLLLLLPSYLRRQDLANCAPPAVHHNLGSCFTKGDQLTKEEQSCIESQALWEARFQRSCCWLLFNSKPVFSAGPHNPAQPPLRKSKGDWNELRHPTHCTLMAAHISEMSRNPFQHHQLSWKLNPVHMVVYSLSF